MPTFPCWILYSSDVQALVDHWTHAASTPSASIILMSPLPGVPSFHLMPACPLRPRSGVLPPESLTQLLQKGGRSSRSLLFMNASLLSYGVVPWSSAHLWIICIDFCCSLILLYHQFMCRPSHNMFIIMSLSSWGLTVHLRLTCIFCLFLSSEPGMVLGNRKHFMSEWMNEYFSKNFILSLARFTW